MAKPQSATATDGAVSAALLELQYPAKYVIATMTVLAAAMLRQMLMPVLHENSPLLVFPLAVLISSWFGGRGPGLYATILSVIVGRYLFFEPRFSFVITADIAVRGGVFTLLGIAITLFINHVRSVARSVRTKERELSEANERYSELLEVTSDSVFLLSRDWRFIYLNSRAVRQISGGRDLIGCCVWDAFPEAKDSEFGRQYMRAIEEQIPVSFTAYYAPLAAWFEVRAYPSESGLAVYFRDVTEHKEAEDALFRSEKRFRSTFDNAAVGMAHVGLNGQWLRVNDRLCEIAGYSREDLLRRTFQDITHPDDIAADLASLKRLLAGEIDSYGMEKRYVDGAGRHRWVYLTASLEQHADGRPLYCIVVVQDIAERKQAEEELRRANEDLRQFAYAASHDLQEPLRMVTSFTQLLQRRYSNALDSQGHEYIEYAVGGAARMEALLRGLRAYWSVSEAERELSVWLNLSDVVSEAVLNLESIITTTGAIVTCDDAPSVYSEATPLTLVFQNLIANAIKYRHPARVPKVHVTAQADGECWRFSVTDNGVGIAPEYQQRVFGLFKRLHPYGDSGTGIGLALCQKVVERRGGRIWIEQSGPEGTTFTFTFPAKV